MVVTPAPPPKKNTHPHRFPRRTQKLEEAHSIFLIGGFSPKFPPKAQLSYIFYLLYFLGGPKLAFLSSLILNKTLSTARANHHCYAGTWGGDMTCSCNMIRRRQQRGRRWRTSRSGRASRQSSSEGGATAATQPPQRVASVTFVFSAVKIFHPAIYQKWKKICRQIPTKPVTSPPPI